MFSDFDTGIYDLKKSGSVVKVFNRDGVKIVDMQYHFMRRIEDGTWEPCYRIMQFAFEGNILQQALQLKAGDKVQFWYKHKVTTYTKRGSTYQKGTNIPIRIKILN